MKSIKNTSGLVPSLVRVDRSHIFFGHYRVEHLGRSSEAKDCKSKKNFTQARLHAYCKLSYSYNEPKSYKNPPKTDKRYRPFISFISWRDTTVIVCRSECRRHHLIKILLSALIVKKLFALNQWVNGLFLPQLKSRRPNRKYATRNLSQLFS